MNTDPVPTPAPWLKRYGPWLLYLAGLLASAAVGAITHQQITPPPPPVVVHLPIEPPAAEPGDFTPTFGWVADPELIAANRDPAATLHFAATDAGRAALGDADVFLWQAVRRVNNRGPPWYPNVNQQSVGCYVGCGWKHAADVCQAMQIAHGQPAEWKPISAEAIYGMSRIDVGFGRISGDGSTGAWAAKAVQTLGVAPMQRYDHADLSTFSPARARQYGNRGVPADVKAVAREHPVKTTALVTSWQDVKRAVQQGYPVAVCSDQGFTMERDSTGRCRPQGTWPHCMAIIGVRANPEGAFILNSWGDAAHTGPVWPDDMPVAGFWADAAVVGRMVAQGDSFALSDLQGFPARRLDWFVRSRPAVGPPGHVSHRFEVALAP